MARTERLPGCAYWHFRIFDTSCTQAILQARPPSRTGAPASASAVKSQKTGTDSTKRQAGTSTQSHPPGGLASTSKRPRTATQSKGSASNSHQAMYQRPMHTGGSTLSLASIPTGPVTPCPLSLNAGHAAARNLVLTNASHEAGMSRGVDGRDMGLSRLPLNAQQSGIFHPKQGLQDMYGGLGKGQRGPEPASISLFSPPAAASLPGRQMGRVPKASFRPRPSIASVTTNASSQGSMTSWAGLRIASSATSIDSGC